MNLTEFIQLVAALLKTQSTLALATSAADGSPHIAPLFYLSTDDLRLYWFSSSSSDHSKNLERNSAAAVSIYQPTDQWKEICGLQMRGAVSIVSDREQRQRIEHAYIARFRLGTLFGAALATSNLYVFQPSWVRYINNSKHFGYKVERSLESAATRSEV